MTTLFKAPQIGEPRSVGVKNQGVTSYDTRRVAPVSRIVGDAFEPGKQIEFRWRSSSGQYHNPRETKLAVRYKLKLGPPTVPAGETDGALAGVDGEDLPSNVRFTACPNTCLFSDGCQYQVNSTMVEILCAHDLATKQPEQRAHRALHPRRGSGGQREADAYHRGCA